MLVIATPAAARASRPARWRWLGKDPEAKRRLEAALGPALPLDDLAHKQARRLRQGYLDKIARFGKDREPVSWWSSSLSWKSWGASDLFLLLTFRAAAHELDDGWLVVEDPWLFRQLQLDFAGHARFEGEAWLPLREFALRLKGLAARLAWLARFLRPAKPPQAGGGVLIRTYVLAGGLDRYLPGLEAELAEAAVPATTVVDEDVRELATFADALRALFVRTPEVDDAEWGLLLRRELVVDESRSAPCDHALFYHAFRRLLAASKWQAVVYPWENQPEERLLALACREAGVRTVGYQHTTLPALQLEFYPGEGELRYAPWPDLILCSGPHWLDILVKAGVPRQRLRVAGARRFPPIHVGAPKTDELLVLLPIDEWQGKQLLDSLRGVDKRFVYRLHPAAEWRPDVPVQNGELADSIDRCAAVVSTGSASLLRAAAAGRPVLRFLCETAVNVDPAEAAGDAIPAAFPSQLPGALERIAPAKVPELFTPVQKNVWLEAVR